MRRSIGVGPGLVLVAGISWAARHAFRMAIGLPVHLTHASIHGDDQYDGVGGNVAVLVLG